QPSDRARRCRSSGSRVRELLVSEGVRRMAAPRAGVRRRQALHRRVSGQSRPCMAKAQSQRIESICCGRGGDPNGGPMTAGRFELYCAIEVEDVPDVRRLVEKVHRRIVTDHDDIARVSMTIHELFENAVKFSVDGNAWLTVALDHQRVQITTRNV